MATGQPCEGIAECLERGPRSPLSHNWPVGQVPDVPDTEHPPTQHQRAAHKLASLVNQNVQRPVPGQRPHRSPPTQLRNITVAGPGYQTVPRIEVPVLRRLAHCNRDRAAVPLPTAPEDTNRHAMSSVVGIDAQVPVALNTGDPFTHS
jgi:hypothetical protein